MYFDVMFYGNKVELELKLELEHIECKNQMFDVNVALSRTTPRICKKEGPSVKIGRKLADKAPGGATQV